MAQIKKRQVAFMAIAIIIPCVVLISLEFLLSVFHYGYDTRLFIEDSTKPGIINTNTHISKLFFSNNKDARLGIQHAFKKVKSPETFRIFVLGESSAFGYPYTQRASFARMLEYRLANTFKNRNIEMINLSITAINSIAFLNFTNEIIEMEPDAILIYAGHNEYYGAMGVGSSHRIGSNRNIIKLIIGLKKFKVSQLILDFSGKIKALFYSKTGKTQEGFMQRMAGKQKIVYGSDVYNKGIEQFNANMNELLSRFHEHHIPVFLSNLVSNEREQKPFISTFKNTTDTISFFKEFRKGELAFRNEDYAASMNSFSAANKIDSTYAMNNFLMGEALYKIGDYAQANRYFLNTKELDALRFRAPEAINENISHLSQKYNNIHFVDVKKKFIENSFNGILDNRLFLDHLHPNMYGYFLISEAFYETIKESGLIGKWNDDVSSDDAWKDLPVTAVDSVHGTWMSIVMKEQWPFYEKSDSTADTLITYPEKLSLMIFDNRINIDMAMDSLYRFYIAQNNHAEAIKVMKSLDLDHPNNWKMAIEIGRLYEESGNIKQSAFYYQKSFREFPNVDIARKIVFSLLQLDIPEETRYYLKYLDKNQPGDQMTNLLLKKTEEVIRLKKQLLTDPENSNAIFDLADYYLFIRNTTEAKKYIDKAITKYPDNQKTIRLQDGLKKLTSGTLTSD